MPNLANRLINCIVLNAQCDCFHDAPDAFLPFGTVALRDLPSILDRLGGMLIQVQYQTVANAEQRGRDRARYDAWLATLRPYWHAGEWGHRMTNGYVFPDTFVCELTRI